MPSVRLGRRRPDKQQRQRRTGDEVDQIPVREGVQIVEREIGPETEFVG